MIDSNETLLDHLESNLPTIMEIANGFNQPAAGQSMENVVLAMAASLALQADKDVSTLARYITWIMMFGRMHQLGMINLVTRDDWGTPQ